MPGIYRNPHEIRQSGAVQPECMVGIVEDKIIGPLFFPSIINTTYTYSSGKTVQKVSLIAVSLIIRYRLQFRHDGAPSHLNLRFRNRWNLIEKPGPPCSLDYNSMDCFFQGYLKHIVHDTGPVPLIEVLRQRIIDGFDHMTNTHTNTHGIPEGIRQSMPRRMEGGTVTRGV